MPEQRDISEQKRMGGVMLALAWLVFLALAIFAFGDLLERQNNPNQNPETYLGSEGQREVVLQRNRYGHYVTRGEINGKDVTFMLDTGATGVAIPQAVADDIGLRRGEPFPTHTANGTSTSYHVFLNSVSVGDIRLKDIPAGISPGLEGEEILLGMSFLQHIEFSQRGDTLTLRQY